MTTYADGLDYDAALDVLYHASTSAQAGVYEHVSKMQLDDYGHVIDVETREFGEAYIDGLLYHWENADTIRVDPGEAYVPQYGRVVRLEQSQTVSIPGTASTMFYLYLAESNGSGYVYADVEPPSEPYFASARTQPGLPGTRYTGAVRNDSAGRVVQFNTDGAGGSVRVTYGEGHDSEALMTYDQETTDTTLRSKSVGPGAPNAWERVVPPSCYTAAFYLQKSGAVTVRFGWPLDQTFGIPPVYFDSGVSEMYTGDLRLGPNQILYRKSSSGTTWLYAFCVAYFDRR
jgi:hypothetical protein